MNMNRFTIIPVAALLLAAAGCVPSLQPLYGPKDVIFDPALVGTWRGPEGDTWRMLGAPDKAYDVLVTEEGDARKMQAHLVQVGQERYFDFFPDELDIKNGFYSLHLLRVHHFVRVRLKQDAVEIAMLDEGWVGRQFDANRYAVRREKVEDAYLLTAPPAELQAFLGGLAKEKNAFADPVVYTRVR